jgi:predicted nuclease of predicted toxin-antitoxin system
LKLLLDENLSRRLLRRLSDHFPGSLHVADLGLQGASDLAIWTAAREGEFVLVSKDDDFQHLALVRGAPPKVVILNIGNASTDAIAERLLDQQLVLEAFNAEPSSALLVV